MKYTLPWRVFSFGTAALEMIKTYSQIVHYTDATEWVRSCFPQLPHLGLPGDIIANKSLKGGHHA